MCLRCGTADRNAVTEGVQTIGYRDLQSQGASMTDAGLQAPVELWVTPRIWPCSIWTVGTVLWPCLLLAELDNFIKMGERKEILQGLLRRNQDIASAWEFGGSRKGWCTSVFCLFLFSPAISHLDGFSSIYSFVLNNKPSFLCSFYSTVLVTVIVPETWNTGGWIWYSFKGSSQL